MNSMKVKFVGLFVLLVGLLSACASQTTNTPASPQPTEAVVSATETPATDPAVPQKVLQPQRKLGCRCNSQLSQMTFCRSWKAAVSTAMVVKRPRRI